MSERYLDTLSIVENTQKSKASTYSFRHLQILYGNDVYVLIFGIVLGQGLVEDQGAPALSLMLELFHILLRLCTITVL